MESGWFVVIGASIGIIPTLIVGWLNQRAEKERHFRQLAMEMALAEYGTLVDIAMKLENKVTILPPTAFIAPAYVGVEKFMDGNIRADEIADAYAEISEIVCKNSDGVKTHLDVNK